MKQAELNKLLNAALKESAKSHNWKFSRGYVFKAAGPLYFTIAILGRANNRYLRYSLSYKWLAFDDVFWTIVESEENRKQPLSFRAAGAWTAPMTRISEGKLTIEDWNADNLAYLRKRNYRAPANSMQIRFPRRSTDWMTISE